MKKLLALLLAVLLPVSALAQTMCFEVKLELDEQNAVEILKSTGIFPEENAEEICDALVDLFQGFGFRLTTQEDAVRADVLFDKASLVDSSVLWGGSDIVITSDLMNGYGLSVPAALLTSENDALLQRLEGTDWMQLLSGMAASAMESLAGVEMTSARGSFSGDAFTGGACCDTYIVDDATVAGFLQALMTPDFRALLKDVLDYFGQDGAAVIAAIDEKNTAVAAENRYTYVIRLVSDGEGMPVGLSAFVMDGDSQLCSLSVGMKEGELRIVAVFPAKGANYWHEQTMRFSATENEKGTSISCQGEIWEYTAASEYAHALAAKSPDATMMKSNWTLAITLESDRLSWTCNSALCFGDSTNAEVISGKGLYIYGQSLISSLTYALNEKPYMTVNTTWLPAAPLDSTGSDLTLCSLIDGDDALLEQIATNFGSAIALRLLQIFPMELFRYFQ